MSGFNYRNTKYCLSPKKRSDKKKRCQALRSWETSITRRRNNAPDTSWSRPGSAYAKRRSFRTPLFRTHPGQRSALRGGTWFDKRSFRRRAPPSANRRKRSPLPRANPARASHPNRPKPVLSACLHGPADPHQGEPLCPPTSASRSTRPSPAPVAPPRGEPQADLPDAFPRLTGDRSPRQTSGQRLL